MTPLQQPPRQQDPARTGGETTSPKGLAAQTFAACAGDVMWNAGQGGVVYCSPEMICDLRLMLFQEALDGAQHNDMNLVRSANRMLQQLNFAQAAADQWRAAGRVSA